MPTASITELKLKKGSVTKGYKINNSAYEQTNEVKNAVVNMYGSYGLGMTVSTKLTGIPSETKKVAIATDVVSASKLKGSKNNSYYNLMFVAHDNNVKDGELIVDMKNFNSAVAGKYTVIAYPLNDRYEINAKPFKLTFNVAKNIPAPSLKLKNTRFELKKQTGDAADIELVSCKNIESINFISLQNGYNKKVMNSFTSFFKVSDFKVAKDANGKLTFDAKLAVKDGDFSDKDLSGKIVINVTMVNGATKDIVVPVTVKATN